MVKCFLTMLCRHVYKKKLLKQYIKRSLNMLVHNYMYIFHFVFDIYYLKEKRERMLISFKSSFHF